MNTRLITHATVQDATRRALAAGALQPIETESLLLDDGGVRFVLRSASSLVRKDKASRQAPASADPLGDYDPDLFVADHGAAHYLLLNKFPLLAGHLLIVSRRFESQDRLLTLEDCEALESTLRDLDGLVFYNGGAVAGASQARKHLQWVPLPLAPESPDEVPMERLFGAAPTLPFGHAFSRIAPQADACTLQATYRDLLRRVGISGVADGDGELQSAPYNLLVRRHWMLIVPRSDACFETIPVNALGFAGTLFVRARADLERVRAVGPMQILRAVAMQGGAMPGVLR